MKENQKGKVAKSYDMWLVDKNKFPFNVLWERLKD